MRTETTTPADTTTFAIGGELPVNRLGFGAMRLTGAREAPEVARQAIRLGVTFIDTADSYDFGENEQLLAAALHPYPADLVIATKAGRINVGGAWFDLGRPEYLRQQAELSLRRLRLDRLDLYQLHRIDATVPLADQIGALEQLREQGKIRHIGLSEITVDELRSAQEIAPIAAVQNRYNLHDRAAEPVLDYCTRHGIAFIPWLPIRPNTRAGAKDPIGIVARRHSASPAQIALAWLLHRSPVIIPIPGTSSGAHLAENMAAKGISLSAEDIAELS